MKALLSSFIDLVKTYVKKRRLFSNKEIVEIIETMDRTKSSKIKFETGTTKITIDRGKQKK